MLRQITLNADSEANNKKINIENLEDLHAYYVQSLNGAITSRSNSYYKYGDFELLKLHKENCFLYLDKYFETTIPDLQTEFIFESQGIGPEDYEAWLDDLGKFWVNSCFNNGDMSEYITPNIKGCRFNPYIRFKSSKSSGCKQVKRLLDLVGSHFIDVDNPFPNVVNLFSLTFPQDISFMLIDPNVRVKIIRKMWKCYKAFDIKLHEYYGFKQKDHILGSSVSLHVWSSEFPIMPHAHFHVVLPHWSYVNVNDSLIPRNGYIKNSVREDIEEFLFNKYEALYSFAKNELDFHNPEDIIIFDSMKVDISKNISRFLGFDPLPWNGKIIKKSKNGIDNLIPLPVDVDVFRNIWTKCVNKIFSKELNIKEGFEPSDKVVYDIHFQFVKLDPEHEGKHKAKLQHYMQYKCRPPILDLDLFFRKCEGFVTNYDSINPESVISMLESKFVNAAIKEDIEAAAKYESMLKKAEKIFNSFSNEEVLDWLRYLSKCKTDTRVFGFWNFISRYGVSSVVRGPLPEFKICPICGCITEKLVKVNDLSIEGFIIHLGSKFLVYNIKDPPDKR